MLCARRLSVHATLGNAVVRAEVLRANRAAVRARFAGAVVVLADDERRRRAAALRTGEDPVARATRGALGTECRAMPARALELPLGALDQDGRFDQLQRMHQRPHLVAADLFSAAPLGKRRDGGSSCLIGLVREDRREVAVEPSQLQGELLLCRGASRLHPLRRFLAQVADEQLEQVLGFARLHRCRLRYERGVRRLDPACFEVVEQIGDITGDRSAGRQIVHVAFHHGLLHCPSRAQHDTRREPPHRVHGRSRLARQRLPVADGDAQLDLGAGARRRCLRGDQAE